MLEGHDSDRSTGFSVTFFRTFAEQVAAANRIASTARAQGSKDEDGNDVEGMGIGKGRRVQLLIGTASSRQMVVRMSNDQFVSDLKDILAQQTGVVASQQILTCGAHRMDSKLPLSTYTRVAAFSVNVTLNFSDASVFCAKHTRGWWHHHRVGEADGKDSGWEADDECEEPIVEPENTEAPRRSGKNHALNAKFLHVLVVSVVYGAVLIPRLILQFLMGVLCQCVVDRVRMH